MEPNKKSSSAIPNYILFTSKILQFFSLKWATDYATYLFVSPTRHKIPERELEMDRESIQTTIHVQKLNKDIVVYKYGNGPKKALLIHGWSGRGTQLVTLANMLVEEGYTTISFDSTGHGKSPKSKSNLVEFIESAFAVNNEFGPFDLVVGHSLGGMTTINTIKDGLQTKKAVIIGSGDVVQDIIDDFVRKLGLKPIIAKNLRKLFEKKYKRDMDEHCVHKAAEKLYIPVLVIHDEDDDDVPIKAAHSIYNHLKDGELFITKGLGHRKVLGNPTVIEKVREFVKK